MTTYLSRCYISVSSSANEPKGAVIVEDGTVGFLSSIITSISEQRLYSI